MQRISITLGQALRRSIFVLGLMLLISVSSSFFFVQQPSYAVTSAATKLTPEEKINRAYVYNEAAGVKEEEKQEEREEAYEQAIKDAESPATMEKAYERNEKAYEKENPQPNLIEKAEELVEKVTGK